MKDGYYVIMVGVWLEFFKVEKGHIFGLEARGKTAWFPTLLCPKREMNLQPITTDLAKESYSDLVTKNQKASDVDIFASIKAGFADRVMSK